MRSKLTLRILVLVILNAIAVGFLPVPVWWQELTDNRLVNPKFRILFVGNSFTFGNGLLRLISALSKRGSFAVETKMIAYGGVYLDWHAENADTLKAIQGNQWNFVVLQDCSTCPLDPLPYFERGVRQMVRIVKDSGATPLLFMTWADQGKFDAQAEITAQYKRLGQELDVAVVPVGMAWEYVQRNHPEVSLFDTDQHHAAPPGTLLTALVFLSKLGWEGESGGSVELRQPPSRIYELVFAPLTRYADSA